MVVMVKVGVKVAMVKVVVVDVVDMVEVVVVLLLLLVGLEFGEGAFTDEGWRCCCWCWCWCWYWYLAWCDLRRRI